MRPLGFFLLFALALCMSCESPEVAKNSLKDYFLKYYGGEGDQTGVDFIVNPDGTFVLLGNSKKIDTEGSQIYVVKIDATGKVLWERRLGGANNEEARDIELMLDGNIVLVGNSEIIRGGHRDIYVAKLSQSGLVLDSARHGLKLPNGVDADDNANSITQVTAGLFNPSGFIVAGTTTGVSGLNADVTDAMHIRMTDNLVRITGSWQDRPTFGSGGFSYQGEDGAVKVVQTDNNTFYVFGYNNAKNSGPSVVGDFDFWIFGRTDQGGAFGSPKYIGDPNFNERLTQVSESPIANGAGAGYILSGSASALSGPDKFVYLARVDKPIPLTPDRAGVLFNDRLNENIFGNTGNLSSFNFASNSNYFITYNTTPQGTDESEIALTKLDGSRTSVFDSKIRLFSGAGNDFCGPIAELADGRIVMVATVTLGGVIDGQKKMAFFKLNSQGLLAP